MSRSGVQIPLQAFKLKKVINMDKFTVNQIQGILLLIATVLLFVTIPFINGRTIGAIIIVAVAIFNLFRKK